MVEKRIGKAKNTIKDFFKNFFKVLRRNDMVVLPGNLAFFFALAIVPAFGFISYGASLLNLSTDFLYNFIAKSFSTDIADIVLGVNLGSNVGIHFIITLIFGLYIASNGADSIITTSNAIYNNKNKSWIKRRIKALGISFLIVLLLLFMLIVPVFGNTITNLVKEVNLNNTITKQILVIFALFEGPISWVIMFVFIKIIYTIAPDKKMSGVIDYGAWFTTFGWIIGTKIYSGYVTNYANYSALYGGLASIVVLLIWIYFLSYIFVVGMALNSQKDDDIMLKNGTIEDKNM